MIKGAYMLGSRLVSLIERHSDKLTQGLVDKLYNCSRTADCRKISPEELAEGAHDIYRNLSDWLLTKTESDVELRYTAIGARRAGQGVALPQLVWAILLSKEHLWAFLQREGLVTGPVELFGELELLQLLDQFFDRAVYYVVAGYSEMAQRKAA
jgi:hypothetical protein